MGDSKDERRSRRRSSKRSGESSSGSSGPPSVWETITNDMQKKAENKTNENDASEGRQQQIAIAAAGGGAQETYMLFVGDRQAGKSTLIMQFLNPKKEDKPKPTVALEYMFARRAAAANAPKDIAHIWELGGGMRVSDLIRVPITAERLPNAVLAIVVDMSKPGDALASLLRWLRLLRSRVSECLDELHKSQPDVAESLVQRARARLGDNHPDARQVDPLQVPLIIIGAKYDTFKDHESVKRKVLSQALRFVAHYHGASLLCVSSHEKALKDHLRALLNHNLFRTDPRRTVETNGERPLIVPAGSDSFESILSKLPHGTDRSDFNGNQESTMNTWLQAVSNYFEPSGIDAEEEAGVPEIDDDAKFPEPAVDAMRSQKDEALNQYRREAERKARIEGSTRSSRRR